MTVDKAGSSGEVPRPMYRRIIHNDGSHRRDDNRADANCPPGTRIPPAAIVIAIAGALDLVAGTVLARDVDPCSRLNIWRRLRHRDVSSRCDSCCRLRTYLHSCRTRRSCDDQNRQRLLQHWLLSFPWFPAQEAYEYAASLTPSLQEKIVAREVPKTKGVGQFPQLPEAQSEPKIQPHGALDDVGRKPVAAVADSAHAAACAITHAPASA
jgi:hypothetical protein